MRPGRVSVASPRLWSARGRTVLVGAASSALLFGSLVAVPGVASAVEADDVTQVAPVVVVPPVCVPDVVVSSADDSVMDDSVAEIPDPTPSAEPTPEATATPEPTSSPTPEVTSEPSPSVERVWPPVVPLGEAGVGGVPLSGVSWFTGDDTVASVAASGVSVDGWWRAADATADDSTTWVGPDVAVAAGADLVVAVRDVFTPSGVRVSVFPAAAIGDAGGQPVVSRELSADDSGVLDATVTLPEGLAAGAYVVQVSLVASVAGDDVVSWRVEAPVAVVVPEPTPSPSVDDSVVDAQPSPEPEASVTPSPSPQPGGVCALPVGGVSAVAGMNTASLSWEWVDGQLSDGDVMFYLEVTGDVAGAGDRVIDVPGDAREFTVDGLRNGVEYSFAVHVATTDGSTPPSEGATAKPSTGVEGEVAGVIVIYAAGSTPVDDTQVPGADVVEQVGLVAGGKVTDSAQVIEFTEAVDVQTAQEIAAELTAQPQIAFAEPDMFLFTAEDATDPDLAQTVTVPNDPEYGTSQWNLWDTYGISIGEGADEMTQAWAGPRGDGVTVAVIDTGITPHPDLDGQLVSGYDFVSSPEQLASVRQANAPPVAFDGDHVDEATFGAIGRDDNPADPGDWRMVAPFKNSGWHGTKMAGVIAAAANNGEGITGIAPGARIQPVRALSWRGGLLSDIAAAITWASGGSIEGVPANQTPSKVINLSFAVQATCPATLAAAIEGARDRGSIVVAAAGNAADDAGLYAPGNCPGVITVGASTRDGQRAGYSNYGPTVDISAPGGEAGQQVLTTTNAGNELPEQATYAGAQGTSVAAAHVSAAAAILASRDSGLTPAAAFEQLTGNAFTKAFANNTCDTANPDYSCGTGILSLAQIQTVASGDQDFAMSLNGTTQAINARKNSDLQGFATNAITLMAWVYPTTCTSGIGAVDKAIVAYDDVYQLACRNGTYQFALRAVNWGWQPTGVAPLLNQWQHVAVTRAENSNTFKFYLNGQLAFEGGSVGTGSIDYNSDTSSTFSIGSEGFGTAWWAGKLDEVRVYSDVRTAQEIAADMHQYGIEDADNLSAYYDFNEGPPGTTGTGTVYNRAAGATSATNLRTVNGPTYTDVKQTTSNGNNTVVTFPRSYLTAAGGWRVPEGVSNADALIVGGGGGGGWWQGGGGGGGGVKEYTGNAPISAGTVVEVEVGQGGWPGADVNALKGSVGQESRLAAITVGAGGGGGSYGNHASSAPASDDQGSGGGGSFGGNFGGGRTSGGSGAGTGSDGAGGGGGGAGANGNSATPSNGGAGGIGSPSSITGTSIVYGSGGGGGAPSTGGSGGAGAGSGGLGNGGSGSSGTAASANRGGGGGGGATNGAGAWGGSGVVIVSYSTAATFGPDDLALTLNGTTQYAKAIDSTPLGNKATYTAEAWFNPSDPSCATLCTILARTNDYSIFLEGGVLGTSVSSGNSHSGSQPTGFVPQANAWNHVALARSDTTVTVYVNGQHVDSYSVSAGAAMNSVDGFFVGANCAAISGTTCTSTNRYFPGLVDEVRFYSTARTQAQIQADMHTYGPVSTTGLVAYYDFNEGIDGTTGSGTVINRAAGAASTTNLTAINNPTYTDVKIEDSVTVSGETIVTFPRSYLTAAGGWQVPVGVSNADALIVGGGGGGGNGVAGGGGGGGGVQPYTGNAPLSAGAVAPVVVGQGGLGSNGVNPQSNGQSSTLGSATVGGGGYGADRNRGAGGSAPSSPEFVVRGSGGGGTYTGASGTGATSGGSTENHFGNGGGGGGATANGGNAWNIGNTSGGGGDGGAGQPSSISGTTPTLVYGSGGGGGAGSGGGGPGGTGGDGAGNGASSGVGSAALPSRGGGGGGGGAGIGTGGSGGSGVVIVSYATANVDAVCVPQETQYYDATDDETYRVVAFKDTGSCEWSVPAGVTSVDYLVVAGGGGGGARHGGGGGAGGMLVASPTGWANQDITVTVGVGGAGGLAGSSGTSDSLGMQGGNSRIYIPGLSTTITAIGGGYGAWGVGGNGGSGGGGGGPSAGGSGEAGQGNDGGAGDGSSCGVGSWCGGGGGGAGASGEAAVGRAGNGGAGDFIPWIDGAVASRLGIGDDSLGSVYFAGGGGGGVGPAGTVGQGGAGGGGSGSAGLVVGQSAQANTGGGGGGGGLGSSGHEAGGNGGSGVVVLRYVQPVNTACTPLTYGYSDDTHSYTVVEFQGAGSCDWTVPSGVGRVDVLAVGGGGGGGAWVGGGGGGGGVLEDTGVSVIGDDTIDITVGAGGLGAAIPDGSTSLSRSAMQGADSSFGNLVQADGGGNGASTEVQLAGSGGSGGGGSLSSHKTGAQGTAGQGNAGGNGRDPSPWPHGTGGGGGAGSAGDSAPSDSVSGGGGAGKISSITGATISYGGGGGGGIHGGVDGASGLTPNGIAGTGGIGGGANGGGNGSGASCDPCVAPSGTDGLGGGGGGSGGMQIDGNAAASIGSTGGDGGDGVVIVRYVNEPDAPSSVVASIDDTPAPNEVTLSWSAPSHVGVGSITGYEVLISADDTSSFSPVGAGGTCDDSNVVQTACTVTGLDTGRTYFFEVKTRTLDGSTVYVSQASDPSNGVAPFGPLAGFTVTGVDDSPIGTQIAGLAFSIRVTAVDDSGQQVLSYDDTVAVTSTSTISAGGGDVGPLVAGVFDDSISLSSTGTQTITATGISGGSEAGTSNSFTVQAAVPATMTISAGDNQSATVGTAVPTAPAVELRDAQDNPVPNASVTFSVVSANETTFLTAPTTPSAGAMPAVDNEFSVYKVTPTADACLTEATSEMDSANATGYSLEIYADSSGSVGSLVGSLSQSSSGTSTVTYTGAVELTSGSSYWVGVRGSTPGYLSNLDLVTGSQSSPWAWATSGTNRYRTMNNGSSWTSYSETTFPDIDLTGQSVSSCSQIEAPGSLDDSGTPASSVTVQSDANGIATSPAWTLGISVGTNYLRASTTGVSSVTFTATATARAITITADNATVDYGDPIATTYARTGDLIGSDVISSVTYSYEGSGSTSYGPSTTPPVDAGTYTVTPTEVTFNPGSASSYSITYVSGGLTIQPAPVTITAGDDSVAYGTATPPAVTYSISGLVNGEDTSVFTTQPSCSTASYDDTAAPGTRFTSSCTGASADNYTFTYVDGILEMIKADQVPVVVTSTSGTFGSVLTLTTSGGSGTGAVSFVAVDGTATSCVVTDDTLVSGGAGTCLVTATKADDTNYNAASSTQTTITLAPATPVPLVWSDDTVAFGDDTYVVPPSVNGVFGATNLAGTWSYSSSDVSVVGVDAGTGIIPANAAGSATITGTFMPSSSNYTSATATMTFTVTKANQAPLVFVSDDTIVFGTSLPIIVSGGSGTGNGSLSVSGPGCSVSGSVLTASGMGPCVLTTGKAGDSNYNAASSVQQTVTVIKADQTVSFTSASPLVPRPNGTYAVSAAATSGLAPTLAIAAGSGTVCSISGSSADETVTFLSSGSCVITATQGGDANFNAAQPVAQSIDVGKLNQSITFTQPADRDFGDPAFALTAMASSGLPVVFSRDDTGTTNAACSVDDTGIVTIDAVGACAITVSQAGNGVFAAASTVTRVFQIVAVTPSAPYITGVSVQNGGATLTFNPPGFDGGAPVAAYRINALPDGGGVPVTWSACSVSVPLQCTMTGLTNGVAYRFTVQAINSAGAGAASDLVPAASQAPITSAVRAAAVGALTAAKGDTTLRVAWTPLTTAQLGGGTFTRYDVRIAVSADDSEVAAVVLNSQGDDSQVFTGLDNGTAYTITVVAITSVNSSTLAGNTATVTEIPARVPDPVAGSYVPTSGTTGIVSWSPPVSDGGAPVIEYRIRLTSGGATVFDDTVGPGVFSTVITGLTRGQSYDVTMTVTNAVGSSDDTTDMRQPDRPAPPVITNAVPVSVDDSTGFEVTWTAPADNGAAITGYGVTATKLSAMRSASLSVASADDTQFTCTSSTTECMMFAPGSVRDYAFVVVADNLAGTSPASAPFVVPDPTPPTPVGPSSPQGVRAWAMNAAAMVTWTPPASAGSFPVSTYQVTSSPGGATCLAPASQLWCEVQGLRNGTTYTFTVSALTGAGWGTPSVASNAVTPSADPQPGPTPGPQPVPGPVPPGSVVIDLDGSTAPGATGGPNPARDGIEVTGPDYSMDMTTLTAGGAREPLAANGELRVKVTGRISVTGDGALPGSTTAVYAIPATVVPRVRSASEPVLVGSVVVGEPGSYAGSWPVPVEVGDYLLQVVATPASGGVLSASTPLVVLPDDAYAILLSGTRTDDGAGRRVNVQGMTTNLDGATVQARVKLSREDTYRNGSTRVVVNEAFTWTRIANRKVYVYFQTVLESGQKIRSTRITIAGPNR